MLEVGCGRGVGTAFIYEHCRPRAMTGVDLARKAIGHCLAHYGRPGLDFVAGDAGNLLFPDGAFDAVLSVESSHCYSDMLRFLRGTHRVLRPNGLLLLADARPTAVTSESEDGLFHQDDVRRLREQLAEASFEVLEEEDITANVMRALQLSTSSRRARFDQRVPRFVRQHALAFSAAEGSPMYQAYAEGKVTYLRFVLKRV